MSARGIRLAVAISAAAAVAAALPSSAARAVHHNGHLSVTAGHTASVPLQIVDRATIDGKAFLRRVPKSVVDHQGAYGGVLIYRGNSVKFGVITDAAMPGPLVLGKLDATLTPGLYRVVVVGDKRVSIDLPLRHTEFSYGLIANGPASVRRTVKDATLSAPLGVGYLASGVHVPRHGAVVSAFTVHYRASAATQFSTCLATDKNPCNQTNTVRGSGSGIFFPISAGSGAVGTATYYDSLSAGNYYVVAEDAVAGLQDKATVVTYVLG